MPDSAWVATFLPFAELMPRLDALLTSGGYDTVHAALQAGVPVLSTGLAEDKAEVGVRVAWSGAGINLGGNAGDFAMLRRSADVVLDQPDCCARTRGLEVGGMNYIIPVDATLRTDRDVQDEAVTVERILNATERARKLRLIVLDACRDNPFIPRMRRMMATRAVGRGLAKVEPEGGTLIAFAARDGQVAQDGTGANSPFAAAFVKLIMEPGLEINMLFRRVRDEVYAATNRKQEPFTYGSLPGEAFYFRPR